MKLWDLIIDGPLDGISNMAIDAALLDEVGESQSSKTIVRFYQWRRPTISLGRNQKIESAVDQEYCDRHGIDVVHRPTGGRAVLHDDELTYAVVSNDSSCCGDTLYANYTRVSEALCSGFQRVGVPIDAERMQLLPDAYSFKSADGTLRVSFSAAGRTLTVTRVFFAEMAPPVTKLGTANAAWATESSLIVACAVDPSFVCSVFCHDVQSAVPQAAVSIV